MLRVSTEFQKIKIKIPNSWRLDAWANSPELQAAIFFRHLIWRALLPSPKVLPSLPSRNRRGWTVKVADAPESNRETWAQTIACYRHRKEASSGFFRGVRNRELFPVSNSRKIFFFPFSFMLNSVMMGFQLVFNRMKHTYLLPQLPEPK